MVTIGPSGRRPRENKVFGFWSGIYIVSALLGAALTAIYLNLEDAVYYWDFAGYFDRFNEQGALLAASPVQWLGQLKTSIATEDLSAAILAPLMPFHVVFGGSRLSYIAGIVTVYLIPTALFIGRMSHMEAVSGAPSSRTVLAVWIAAFLYTPFWAPTLRGLPDIAGCLALAGATYYLWKSEFLTREPVSSGVRVGAYLWLAFMLRRWYAFAVMGIAISAAFFCLFQAATERKFLPLRNAALGGIYAILVIVAAALIFQQPLVVRIMGTSYADLYSGYRTTFVSQLAEVGSRLSYLNWLLILLGLCISVVRRNRFSLLCAVASVLTFLIFSHTQDPDRHHSLPMFLWLFPAYAQAIVAIVSMPALRWRWSTAVIAIAAILAFAGTFFPIGRQLLSPVSFVFAREDTLPLHLDNLPEYGRLMDDLASRMGPEDRFSVFASSPVMNEALLYEMNKDLSPHVSLACQVDSREQFRPETLQSRYIVATDPPVAHLQPGAQLCITIPDQYILEGKGIGAAYKRIETYQLSGGVAGYLYEQMRPVSKAEIEALYAEFRKKYPDWTTPQR
ncbi:hypothetical protein [Mesorhizobium loti]|uniref:Glycosyltransferase RgtA/B/C/D-like domain-containing protein n=1 Tax=Mesorhizobium loti R88b TaxID=935548 RepID=A0A6M7WT40_RHILI|nr:hypothetical protein [Mesorhizobium loti]QKD03963.1 hypothetical protein EB235_22760 [Mesorhizobium loti R88b]